jgi:hypothetical protein
VVAVVVAHTRLLHQVEQQTKDSMVVALEHLLEAVLLLEQAVEVLVVTVVEVRAETLAVWAVLVFLHL